MSITSGRVSIEDGKKAAEEYAPARKVIVDLHFEVPEGSDYTTMLELAATTANTKVQELLGRAAAAKHVVAAAVVDNTKVVETPKAAKASKKEAAPAKPEKTKDDLAREAGVLVDDPAPKASVKPAAPTADDLGDILGEEAAPVAISDAELGSAAQKKNASMHDKAGWAPAKIRALVLAHAGEGKQLRDIPATARAQFLQELEALK